jgi:hypothetical protein
MIISTLIKHLGFQLVSTEFFTLILISLYVEFDLKKVRLKTLVQFSP